MPVLVPAPSTSGQIGISIADTFARTQFGDMVIPVEQHVVHGRGRWHPHVYWKAPGAAPEKGGRELYNVSITVPFDTNWKQYPDLYPNTMNRTRALFEAQATRDFVHPTIGTFPAFIIDWKQVKRAKNRSGEVVEIELVEDQLSLFAATSFTAAAQGNVGATAASLSAQLFSVSQQLKMAPGDQSIFDALQNAANAVTAVKDTATLYGNTLAAKTQQLMNICYQADSLASMQDPRAWPVIDALRDLWAAANRIMQDLQSKQAQLQTYVVPQTTSIASIAIALYGLTSRVSDLEALNPQIVTTSQTVRAGTILRYYP